MAFMSSLERGERGEARAGMEECGEEEVFIKPGSDMMDCVRLEMMSLVLELVSIWD